jgi:Spy/CpxP family protein refolding chaperone
MKKIILCAFALALATFTVPAFAQKGPGPDGNGKGSMMRDGEKDQRMIFNPERLKKRLNLSDDQVAKIEDINKKYFGEYKAIADKRKPKDVDLRKALKEDPIDLNKVKGLMTDLSSLKVESGMLMIRQYLEIESVFTPEQKEKSRKAMAQFIDHGMIEGRKK